MISTYNFVILGVVHSLRMGALDVVQVVHIHH